MTDPNLYLLLPALAAAGLCAGFIGGLFGVGGGVVIVPALFYAFRLVGVADAVAAHAAVATSLSTILATSWRSLSAHRKAGAVDFSILRAWTPWIALGAAGGGALAHFLDASALLGVFGVGLLLAAATMGFGAESWRLGETMPAGAARAVLAGSIGALSALMGIGGGVFGVLLMTLFARPIHQAVATASGFGAAIAAPAVLANILTGWGEPGLAPFSLGYVNLPGFVILGLLTGFAAPWGARAAHRLDRSRLRRAFAVFLAVMAVNMLREALSL